jgi:hypothetical protein
VNDRQTKWTERKEQRRCHRPGSDGFENRGELKGLDGDKIVRICKTDAAGVRSA